MDAAPAMDRSEQYGCRTIGTLRWNSRPLTRRERDALPLRSHAVQPFDRLRARHLLHALELLEAEHPDAAALVAEFCQDVYWTKLRGVYQGVTPDFAVATFAALPKTAFLTDRALIPHGTASLAEALVTAAVRQRLFAGPPLFVDTFEPKRAPKVPVPWRHRPGLPFAFWPLDRALHEVAVLLAVRALRPLTEREGEELFHLAAAARAQAASLAEPGRAVLAAL